MPTGQLAPWRGRRMTRTSWQKYLPPNWAPMPMCLGHLAGSLLPFQVAVCLAVRCRRRRQGVVIVRRRHLDGFQRCFRRRAADHDGKVIGRAGRSAEGTNFLVEKSIRRFVQQRLGFWIQERLVRRPAALGDEQEFIGVALRRHRCRFGPAGCCRCCLGEHIERARPASSAGWSRDRFSTRLRTAPLRRRAGPDALAFFPMTIAVPVSWHIGKMPPAAMLAFFSRSNATKRSLSDDSGSSKILRSCCRCPGRSRCETSLKASNANSVSAFGSTLMISSSPNFSTLT